jgi:ferredoxin--NADP+ reductase
VSLPGKNSIPLRVAIIGSGPAAFYAAEHLFKQRDLLVEVDMFERLPTPYGLVRYGVAPDHQKIKSVVKVYERLASRPNFRFYGNVELGRHVSVADLRNYYHQIVYATGAQTDRALDIPGEDLQGSHAATEFVAWFNGHPDYRDCQFDLSQERVAVVGVGNVAVDVARILCRTTEELAETDIADYALEALRHSKVKEVYILGRRGPAQAAFTNPEAKELGEMPGADMIVFPEEAALDPLSAAELAASDDRETKRKVEILQEFAARPAEGKARRLVLRFLVSPVELVGDASSSVTAMKIVKNKLVESRGKLSARPTDQYEELPVGLVFRSVGYRGVPLPDVPFRDDWGIIPNEAGRIIDPETKQPLLGEYVTGWIKRGPSGVIGTNKPDAVETVECMIEDLNRGVTLTPAHHSVQAAEAFITQRQPNAISFADWQRLDQIEVARGKAQGRPRVKFVDVEEMLRALGREPILAALAAR